MSTAREVTLLEVDLDQILKDDTLLTRLQAAKTQDEARAVIKDAPVSRSTSTARSRSNSRQRNNLDVGDPIRDRQARDARLHIEPPRPRGAGIHTHPSRFAALSTAAPVTCGRPFHDVAPHTARGPAPAPAARARGRGSRESSGRRWTRRVPAPATDPAHRRNCRTPPGPARSSQGPRAPLVRRRHRREGSTARRRRP